jgi:hypothetical protein
MAATSRKMPRTTVSPPVSMIYDVADHRALAANVVNKRLRKLRPFRRGDRLLFHRLDINTPPCVQTSKTRTMKTSSMTTIEMTTVSSLNLETIGSRGCTDLVYHLPQLYFPLPGHSPGHRPPTMTIPRPTTTLTHVNRGRRISHPSMGGSRHLPDDRASHTVTALLEQYHR